MIINEEIDDIILISYEGCREIYPICLLITLHSDNYSRAIYFKLTISVLRTHDELRRSLQRAHGAFEEHNKRHLHSTRDASILEALCSNHFIVRLSDLRII